MKRNAPLATFRGFKTKEVAKATGFPLRSVQRAIASGELGHVKIGAAVRVLQVHLEEWARRWANGGTQDPPKESPPAVESAVAPAPSAPTVERVKLADVAKGLVRSQIGTSSDRSFLRGRPRGTRRSTSSGSASRSTGGGPSSSGSGP